MELKNKIWMSIITTMRLKLRHLFLLKINIHEIVFLSYECFFYSFCIFYIRIPFILWVPQDLLCDFISFLVELLENNLYIFEGKFDLFFF